MRHVLLELERAGWDSLCNQTGSEYYGELMLPNALMVLANGIGWTPATEPRPMRVVIDDAEESVADRGLTERSLSARRIVGPASARANP